MKEAHGHHADTSLSVAPRSTFAIIVGILAVVIGVFSAQGFAKATEPVPDRAALVSECKREANRGHFHQLFSNQVLQHKKRMGEICQAWLTINDDKQDEHLAECLAESKRGPMNIRRGRNRDAFHVMRLKEVCGKLRAKSQ